MNIRKRLCLTLLIAGSLITLTGCGRKVVRTEKFEGVGIVKSIDYNAAYTITIPVYTGKSTTIIPQTYPEDYDTIIEYKGVEYNSGSPELYKYIKDNNKVNKEVKCSLETVYYDDDSSRTNIVKVEGIDALKS